VRKGKDKGAQSDAEAIGARLARALADKSLSIKEFSTLCDVPYRTAQGYLDGSRAPGAENLATISAQLSVDLNWLLLGEGSIWRGQGASAVAGDGELDYVPVLSTDAVADSGSAVSGEEHVVDHLPFKRQWLQDTFHTSARDLCALFVEGDAMAPTLGEGDLVLIDRRSEARSPRDGVYVVRLAGRPTARRAQLRADGSVLLKTDNPAYDAIEVEPHGVASLDIVGRVVWIGSRL